MAAICWSPWIARRVAVSRLIAGVVVVVFTEKFGSTLTEFIGFGPPPGRLRSLGSSSRRAADWP
jgi:hypothetical protein